MYIRIPMVDNLTENKENAHTSHKLSACFRNPAKSVSLLNMLATSAPLNIPPSCPVQLLHCNFRLSLEESTICERGGQQVVSFHQMRLLGSPVCCRFRYGFMRAFRPACRIFSIRIFKCSLVDCTSCIWICDSRNWNQEESTRFCFRVIISSYCYARLQFITSFLFVIQSITIFHYYWMHISCYWQLAVI